MCVANYKLPSADISRRDMLHLAGQNQRGRGETIVIILGHIDAALPAAQMVGIIDVLDADVESIRARLAKKKAA